MSNRFTKYTVDKLRVDGWLDKEQADHLRTQLKSVEAERDEAKRLLVETLKFSHFGMPGVFPKPDWFARRDAFLNPKPQDVK